MFFCYSKILISLCYTNYTSLFFFFFFFFFFLLVLWGNWLETVENFSSLFFCFFVFLLFFSSYLPLLYYAQDISKKWQEIYSKLSLTFADKVAVIFSSRFLFCFVFVFLQWSSEETGKRQSKISRHFFVFVFFFFSTSLLYLYYAQDSSKKWQEI